MKSDSEDSNEQMKHRPSLISIVYNFALKWIFSFPFVEEWQIILIIQNSYFYTAMIKYA